VSRGVVTCIIVTYDSADTIARTLEATQRCHEAGLLECVVVDNQSRDGTAELVRRTHPWVRLVESPENLGFGRACNLGFQGVDTPYVLFLNPDAWLEPDALELLIDFLEQHPRAGLVAPASRNPGGRRQLYGKLPTPWRLVRAAVPGRWRRHHLRPMVWGRPPERVEWICGAVMLLRTDVFRRLGGFDPRFFLYFEETDLLHRMRDSGMEVWAVNTALAMHAGHGSASKSAAPMVDGCIAEHYFRSRFYYLMKHHGLASAAGAELVEFTLLSLTHLLRRAAGRGGEPPARWSVPPFRLPAAISRPGPDPG
jgi:GT2 family glycosyltransferase